MTVVSRYTGGFVELAPCHVEELRTQLRGELVLPGDAHYDKARTVWNAAIDKRPAMIARCADASDVVEAVKFARRQDILVSVRCGGHNIAGKAVAENGLMIDLTPMCDVRVDPENKTAVVGGGAALGDRLRQWNATHSEQTSRARRLIDLADTAKSTLDQADDRLKRTIIDLLDIRVRITGTIPCRTCDGRGLVPASRATQGQGLGRTGQICPTCHRFRRLPKLEIAGAIPDTPSLDNSLKHNNVLPFTLNPAVNRR